MNRILILLMMNTSSSPQGAIGSLWKIIRCISCDATHEIECVDVRAAVRVCWTRHCFELNGLVRRLSVSVSDSSLELALSSGEWKGRWTGK